MGPGQVQGMGVGTSWQLEVGYLSMRLLGLWGSGGFSWLIRCGKPVLRDTCSYDSSSCSSRQQIMHALNSFTHWSFNHQNSPPGFSDVKDSGFMDKHLYAVAHLPSI